MNNVEKMAIVFFGIGIANLVVAASMGQIPNLLDISIVMFLGAIFLQLFGRGGV